MVSDNAADIQTSLKHSGHLIPCIPYLSSINTAQIQSVKDHRLQIHLGICPLQTEKCDLAAVLHIVDHIVERCLGTGHLKTNVKALCHSDFFHNIRKLFFAQINYSGSTQLLCQVETVLVEICHHHVSCTRKFYDSCCHDADRTCACHKHILAQYIIRKGCVSCISKRIKNRVHLFRYIRIAGPYVRSRDDQILRKRSVAVYAYALGILAVFLVSFQTVAAFSTCDMSFSGHQVTDIKSANAFPCLHDFPNILVAGRKTNGNRMLCPVIPLPDMYVCPADRCLVDLDLHIIRSHLRYGYSLHPESLFRFLLDKRPHHCIIFSFSHDIHTSIFYQLLPRFYRNIL